MTTPTDIKLPHGEPFAKKWAEWIAYRKEIRKSLTSPKAITGCLNQFWIVSEKTAIEMIDVSIRNQWQGIFPLRKNGYEKEDNIIYSSPKEFERTTYQSATPKEMYEGIKRIALQTGKLMKVADWSGAYKYAWKEKLIHRMDETERNTYKASVREALKSEIRAKMKPENFKIDNSIQYECHRRIIQAHFQELINKNQES